MLNRIRKSKVSKFIAVFIALLVFNSVIEPMKLFALTSGPSQPEVQSFEPVGTTDMVNLFSGDFVYNIPLFELPGPDGGYPFNISYHSGITMEQEASWVGLGWSLNPGAINRDVRNIPDEFNGEPISITKGMKPNITYGGSIGVGYEFAGLDFGKIGLTSSVMPYYNNYKGFGLSVNTGFNIGVNTGTGSSTSIGGGLGLSVDSQQGIGASASLSIQSKQNKNEKEYSAISSSIGVGYNSREGMKNVSFTNSVQNGKKIRKEDTVKETYINDEKGGGGGTSTLSFTGGALGSLNQSSEFRGWNINLSFRLGVNLWLNHGSVSLGGFYNEQKLKDNYGKIDFPTYGYLNINNCYGSDYNNKDINGIGDFSREKDNAIYSKTEYLPIPNLNQDVYSVVGQGIGNMFRPKRSDFGIIADRYQKSRVTGFNLGGEIGLGNGMRWGLDLGFNYSDVKSGMWRGDYDDALVSNLGFHNSGLYADYETYYFKTYGEHNANDYQSLYQQSVYSEKPAIIKFEKESGDFDSDPFARNILRTKGNEYDDHITKSNRGNREIRSVSILPVLISDIKSDNSSYAVLNEMTINRNISSTVNPSINPVQFENSIRSKRPNHIAGFVSTNSRGVRYIYGLPAYNKSQNEYVFSIPNTSNATEGSNHVNYNNLNINPDNYEAGISSVGGLKETDQYYSKTEYPEYPYAYLLTSVLGPDYVDIDNIPGPSDGDLGYWVKFDYVQTTDPANPYKWRAPYANNIANYLPGYNTDTRDDKAAFMEGTKEIWYLKSAETKSHKVEFAILPRSDGKGANNIQQYKLDNIKLFSKKDLIIPVKTIKFNYDNSLCNGVINGDGTNGKLTLTSIQTFYKDDIRNSLSPYKFEYSTSSDPDENPNYNADGDKTDRWGFYNPDNTHPNIDPYIDQATPKPNIDSYSKAWNLKKITLPSGGDINIDYESDDYAYVQDKVAMQMTEIIGIKNHDQLDNSRFEISPINCNNLYFPLERQPVAGEDLSELAKKYISPGEELYFRVKIKLKTDSQYEYIAGYAKVNSVSIVPYETGTYCGMITLDYYKDAKQHTIPYHPFAVAGWQHLKTNQPDLFYNDLGAPDTEGSSDEEKANFVVSFLNVINNEFSTIFKGIYDHCAGKGYCDQIKGNNSTLKSWVRLRTPDKIKYGGGARVKKLTFNNNWSSGSFEGNEQYGQIYDYSMQEDGQTISSGVAEYEPLIGGDENPLRQPKRYFQHIPMKADNEFYAEEPFNESLYPGANVGYRKVTVTSLSTYNSRLDVTNSEHVNNASPTGSIAYEFYTAKDFPVKVDETQLSKNRTNRTVKETKGFIPLPFIGSIANHRYTATQGYSIVLNDMHGKIRKITNLNESGKEVNHVEYIYSTDKNDNTRLNNRLDVVLSDNDPLDDTKAQIAKRDIGVEYDFFADMRESHSYSLQAGVAFNSEIMIIPPLPAFFPWPSYTQVVDQVRTIVTNKIIHKSGILIKVISKDGNSTLTTENKYFDPVTGEPLLTTTTNDFDKPVYKYNFPARWYYSGMGPSSTNLGMISLVEVSPWTENNLYQMTFNYSAFADYLFPGDELILTRTDYAGSIVKHAVNYLGKRTDVSGTVLDILYSKDDLIEEPDYETYPVTCYFKIVKSGHTNLNDINSGVLTALADPTINRNISNQPPMTVDAPELTTSTLTIFDPLAITKVLDFFNTAWPHLKNEINNGINEHVIVPGSNSSSIETTIRDKFADFLVYFIPASHPECSCLGYPEYDDQNPCTIRYFDYGPYYGNRMNIGIYKDGCYYDGFQLFACQNGAPYCSGDLFPYGVNKDNLENIEYIGPNGSNSFILGFNTTDHGQIRQSYNSILWACQKTSSSPVSSIYSSQPSINATFKKLNKVISFEASTYSDSWQQSANSLLNYSPSATSNINNQYGNGEKGIWKKRGSYLYIDKRHQTSGNVNIAEDGYMNDVPIYAWANNNFDAYSTKWRKQNYVLSYNPYSYEEESQDRFGNYSSALYGLGGEFMTALANNACLNEIGYEGFEDYQHNATISQKNCSPGNLDIYHQKSDYTSWRKYDVTIAKGNLAVIDKPYSYDLYSNAKMEAATIDNGINENISTTSEIVAIFNGDPYFPGKTVIQFKSNKPGFSSPNNTRLWKGTVSLPENHFMTNTTQNSFVITNEEHHTGKNSLWLDNYTMVSFEQNRLKLVPGQQYLFSAWVKASSYTGNHVASYSALPLTNSIGIYVYGNECNFVGKIIDGWQKIEIEFTANNENTIAMYANGNAMYVDDIRVSPKKSTIKTFVYNPDNYKLSAVMDENNYSTFYYYDQEGKLYQKKQETEKGIVTLQESHSSVKQHPIP